MNTNEAIFTQAPLPGIKPFNYYEFQQTLENPAVFSEDLKSYLARPEVAERFTKPISHFFPRKESNISEAWKNANASTFAADNTPINKAAMDLMTYFANDLDISIVKTFEYLNKVVKSNPELVKIVVRPDISLHYQNTIETMIINLVHKDRTSMLRGINAVIIALDESPSERQKIIQDFASTVLESNVLINMLIDSYQANDHTSIAPFFRKNPELYISGKLKEEFLILSSIFGLFSQGRVQRDFSKIFGKLFGLFLKQKFEGSLHEIMEQMKLSSHNISTINNDTSDKNGILILFILLAGIFTHLNFSGQRGQVNLPHLVTINKEITGHLKSLDDSNRVLKVVFFQNIYALILKACLLSLDPHKNASDASIINSTIMDLDTASDDSFADNIVNFLRSARKFKQPTLDSFREIFKSLIEIIAFINIENPDVINDIFINRDIKNKILLKIFKEIMKNGKILCDFWKDDFEHDTRFSRFTSDFLNSFPFDKVNFLKVVDSILGSSLYPFAEEVLGALSKLPKITMEITGRLDASSKDFSKSKNRYNTEGLELRSPMTFANDIVVYEGTMAVQKPGYANVYEFTMNHNFWESMYKDLTEFIVSHQGARKVTMADHIRKYLKLISKMLTVSPNLAYKMQEMFSMSSRSNLNIESSSNQESSPILFFVLFDAFRLIQDRPEYSKISCHILQAIKSLLVSRNSATTIFFTKLYPLVSDTEISPVHVFIDFYNSFRVSEGDIDSFRYNQRHFYRGLVDIIDIFKVMIADEEIWVSSILGNSDVWSKDASPEQATAENSLKRLAELYLDLTNENSWLERADEIQSTYQELFNLREYVSTNILNELWESFVIPLCRRFLKDDFDVTQEHISYKYNLYKALFELVNCFLEKINYKQSKLSLKSSDYKEDLKPRLMAKLVEFADALPLREMIIEAMEVNIDSSKLSLPMLATQKGLLGVVNKHWSVNVEQRRGFMCEASILEFLATSLETLALVAKTCRLEVAGSDRKEESNFLKGFYKDFCYRESIYKYKFDSFNDNQSVNIIVALISSLILENEREKHKFAQKAVSIENSVAPYSNYDWQHSDQLFPDAHDGNKFLFYINLDLLYGRAFETPKFLEKPRSVVEAGMGALSEILNFWHTQQKVKRPNLEDYVLGLYNDLPNSRIIMDKFALALTASISEGHSSAFNLLLQLQEFQPRFLEEYFRVGEPKEGTGNNSLVNLFMNSLKNLSGMANVTKLTFSFLNARENLFKLALFIIKMLRSRRISKTIIDQLWSTTFESLIEHVFKHIANQKEPFHNSFEFIYDFMMNGKFEVYDWNPSLSWTFNVLKLEQLTKLSNLQDRVLGEITDLVCWAFVEKLSKKNVHFIDRHSINFFKNFSSHSQGLIENVISDFVLNGHKIMSFIQDNILEEVLVDLNAKRTGNRRDLNPHRSGFINVTQINNGQKISFVQNPVAKTGAKDSALSTQARLKSSFDSLAIFLGVRSLGFSQTDSNKLAYVTCFYNQVEQIMASKAKAQAKFIKFLNVIYSVGLEGNYAGSAFTLIPTPDIPRYILGQCNKMTALNNEYVGVSHQLLHAQFMSLLSKNTETFNESATLATDLNIQSNEKAFLMAFATKANSLNFSVLNILLKDGLPRLTEGTISSVFDSLTSRLSFCSGLLEYFSRSFLKNDTFAMNYSNVSYDILIRIIHLSNAQLVLTAHLVANLFPAKQRDPSNIAEALEAYIRFLSDAVPLVLHFYKTLTADVQPFLCSLLYSFYILRVLKKSIQPDIVGPTIEFVNTVLVKSKDLSQMAIHLIDVIFSTNPDQLQSKDINQLSERLTRNDLTPTEFNLIIQVLTNFAVNGDNRSKILGSNLFKNILQINVISSSRNFQQGILYHHQIPDESHAMFCHLLTMVSFLVQMHKDTPNVLHFALSFITKFQKRYELILGIGHIGDTDRSQNFDLTIQYQNQAFLEELALILANLAIVTQESDFWANKNKHQFYSFLYLLTTRTIKIFSHELFNQNFNSSRFSQFLAVSDRFNPISRFETQLQGIGLKSMAHNVPVRPTGSIMKSAYDPKTSMHSELNRFKDFKNVFLTQASHSSNLFAFKLENLVNESIFSVGLAISSMMEIADFEEIYLDPANSLFDDLFFRNFNHTLIDIQLFLLYSYQKLSIYPDTYKDGCVHLEMVSTSAEAKIQTHGVSTLGAIYALPEMKNVVRKAFEMSFYLQTLSFQIFDRVDIRNKHFYIDELKKQQEKSRMLLQDFESYLVRKENISSSMIPKDTSKFYSPIKSPYKSVAKFTPRNIVHELGAIDEETAKLLLVNPKSLDVHVKFLEFIRNYYNIK